MIRLRHALVVLRGQLWLVPSLMSVAAVALAYAALRLGGAVARPRGSDLWWLFSGDADSARGLLAALLSGLVSMTSLVVSLTFVSLTLAANQLGPRLIQIFIGDRQIQAFLGLFLATIFYLLVVLRSVDGTQGDAGVPHLAVTLGSVLTAACLLALLFYVHKVAKAVIADTVIREVADDLQAAIAAMLPERPGGGLPEGGPPDSNAMPPRAPAVALDRSGYVQTVDHAALVGLAQDHDAALRLTVRAGDFVLARGDHVEVMAARPLDDRAVAKIRRAFALGGARSPAQDLEFPIRQLVEIALRALSPGINDPFTAVAVVDRLGAALEQVLARAMPPTLLRDESGTIRVIVEPPTPEGLLDAAFDPIRQAAADQPIVLTRIAGTLALLAPSLDRDGPRRAALRSLDHLAETAARGGLLPADSAAVLARVEQARATILASP